MTRLIYKWGSRGYESHGHVRMMNIPAFIRESDG